MDFDPSRAVLLDEPAQTQEVFEETPSATLEFDPSRAVPVENMDFNPERAVLQEESAGIGKSFAQGALDFGLGVPIGLATLAAGGVAHTASDLTGAIGLPNVSRQLEEWGDSAFRQGDDAKKILSEAILTPEDRQKQTLTEKVVAATPMIPAMMAMGPAGALVGALGAFSEGARNEVQAGGGHSAATAVGTLQAASTLLMLGVPAYGKTMGETAAYTLASGPLVGAGADWLSEMVSETPQGKSPYAMYNPDGTYNKDYLANRITETVIGGAVGAYGQYKWKQAPDTALATRLNAMSEQDLRAYLVDKDTYINDLFGYNKWQSAHQAGETWEQTRERFFKSNDGLSKYVMDLNYDDGRNLDNVPQALEIMYHTTQDPYTKAYAAYLLERTHVEGLNWVDILTLSRKYSNLYNTTGDYDPNYDRIRVAEMYQQQGEWDPATQSWAKVPSPGMFDATLLHEIEHARTTTNLLSLEAARDPNMEKFRDTVFPELGKKVRQWYQIPDSRWANKPSHAGDGNRWRGFDDIFEFFSEVTAGKQDYFPPDKVQYKHIMDRNFREDLRGVPISEKDALALMPPRETGLIPANTQRLYDVLRETSNPKITNLYDIAVAWHEYFMRSVDAERPVTSGHWNIGTTEEFTGPRPAAVKALGDLDTLKQKMSDDMGRGASGNKDQTFWRTIWYHLQTSNDAREFQFKILNIDPTSKPLAEFAANSADKIWARKDFYADVLSKEMGPKDSLPSAMRRLMLNDQSAYEFLREEAPVMDDGSDIKLGWFGRNFFNPATIRLLVDKQGFAGRVTKFYIEKMMQYTHAADKIYHQLKTQDAKEYYTLSKSGQRHVMNAVSFFDSIQGRKTLQGQWPDDAQLRAQGLIDEEIAGYRGLQRATDNTFAILNLLQAKLNQPPIKQIPGYMPHYHTGPYKVHLTYPYKNKEGEIKHPTVIVRGFSNGWAAERFAKTMMDRGFGIQQDPKNLNSGKPYRVFRWDDVGSSMLQNYKDHVDAFINLQDKLSGADADTAKSIQDAEDIALKEFNKHALEREGVRGYVGEYGTGTNPLDSKWSKFKNKVFGESEALHIHDKYFREVAEMYKNVMFMEEVMAPIMGLDNTPMSAVAKKGDAIAKRANTFKYLDKLGKNFLGKNMNHLAWVDNTFRGIMLGAKLDPNLVKNFNRTMRNVLGQIKLRVNPANWAANYLQKTHAISVMMYLDLISDVEPGGALAAFIRTNSKSPEELGPAHLRAINRARSEHIVDPLLDMEIGGDKTGLLASTPGLSIAADMWKKVGDVNRHVEKHGRENVFLTAFDHYLTKGMTEENAYKAAEIVMGMTMVNYDRAARPLMYQDFGMLGEAASPFAVFRNAALGNMWLMMKEIAKNPKHFQAAKPLMASMLTFMAMAGATGIPLVGEYNMIANFYNYMFPGDQDFPEAEVLMLKAGVPDILMYGLPAEASKLFGFERGINLGASAGAVNVGDAGSLAILPFYKALAQIGWFGVKAGMGAAGGAIPPSVTDLYDPMRKVTPNIVHPFIERWMSGDWQTGLKSTSVEGLTTREPADVLSMMLAGKPSVGERKERTVNRYLDRLEAHDKEAIKALVTLRADTFEGKPTIWDGSSIDQRVMVYYDPVGGDIEMFYKRVAKEVERRKLSKVDKESLRTSPSVLYRQSRKEEALGLNIAVPDPTTEE